MLVLKKKKKKKKAIKVSFSVSREKNDNAVILN